MLGRRTDLPLDRDGLGRFLPWLIAFMVYLSILSLSGIISLAVTADRWDRGMRGTLTVQIMPRAGGRGWADPAERQATDAVVGILRATEGVAGAEPLGDEALAELLRPWLGDMVALADLPIPRLVDVRLEADAEVDLTALSRRLALAVPGASIDDHGVWLERMVRLIHTAEALAVVVLLFIGLATVGTVVFTTRTGLAVHHEAIEVLHLTGAQDSYIADQFGGRAFALGLRGGLIGLALAVPTLYGLGSIAESIGADWFPQTGLAVSHWVTVATIPLVIAAIAMMTARLTVMRMLSEML